MILPVLLVLLIGVPVLELYVIVKVGSLIGFLPTIGLMVLTSLLGAWLLRLEGTRAWRAFLAANAEHRPPHREAVDGVLILVGGTLMLVPGFVSDVLGLLFLLPPTRWVLRNWTLRQVTRRGQISVLRVRSRREPPPPRRPGPHVVEGETVDPDRPGGEPPGREGEDGTR